MVKKRPCCLCLCWFLPDPRVGSRQRVCSSPACQDERQRRNVAAWTKRNPEYPAKWRMQRRERAGAKGAAVDPLQVSSPLSKLPWGEAQKQFGVQGADFIRELGRLLLVDPKK